MGGHGDTGTLEADEFVFEFTARNAAVILFAYGGGEFGTLRPAVAANLLDVERRSGIEAHHTATHL